MRDPDLIPPGLRDTVIRHVADPGLPDGAAWLATLPRLVAEVLGHWRLRRDGPARHGYSALVLPVRRTDGTPAIVKLVWPHAEGRTERLALRTWDGDGAVRLLAAEPGRWALLLERLDERDLNSESILDGAEELGRLAARLDRPAPAWAPRLSEHLATLVVDIDALRTRDARGTAFPRRLLEAGRALAVDLGSEADIDARLVHADLHPGNVLWRPDPGEWVAIDAETMAADPAFALSPLLWNRWEQAQDAHDLRGHLQLRLDVACAGAGLDYDRARAFALVRCVRNAIWELDATEHPGTAAEITRSITIIKALQSP
ncbi:aminoglycoside phosphotransferase family protein [Occultella aeris]|uniref:Aminoglycoside/hydroxyurea antibiotic resistance kinase n=1 Tax=Occultella aeris TaxID=2761496 RepID=A0A7M4DH10_9MICO|nr:aminoglycoside phosphotransferase family protein [Occultella aeris]VZO36203.1 Aminoglycoside/hydroxyurea antibiotic resistance kinase [Occultella aeris]